MIDGSEGDRRGTAMRRTVLPPATEDEPNHGRVEDIQGTRDHVVERPVLLLGELRRD